jgi:release factor glutamine methyltransferase
LVNVASAYATYRSLGRLLGVGEALRWGERALSESGRPGRADALLLLAHALERSREWVIAHDDAALSFDAMAEFVALCERRRAGEPIAYVLGAAWFYGREFLVDATVLVPRPETEHLVDEAIRFIQERRMGRVDVLDVGVGCGAIACTIAAETGAFVAGTDISGGAIAAVTENARRLNVVERCSFHCGDLVEPVRGRRFDVVVTNLPYIPTGDLPQRPNPASFEPGIALDGGPTGLAVYERLMSSIARVLKPDGFLLCEAAPPTIEKLRNLVERALPNFVISVSRDYAGLDRYIKASTAP